jgi:type IV secretory pathway TraG/TraD family ATPase VirD4
MRYPMVENVADEAREWGYIRSTAAKALKPLAYPNARRVFAGGPGVEQPDFSRTDGRDIVIWRPDWSSAARTYRLITAGLHATIMSAVRGGYAGGPGTTAILDEAGSFMRLSRLGTYLDLARGGKLNMLYVLQSRTQLAAQLGRDEAERIWAATEAKIVGPTTDLQLARDIAALSGQRRVHYSGPRQHDEILAQRRETTRNAMNETELTGQQEGEFTLVHRGKIVKYRVPRKFYHHRQAKQPPEERPRPHGVADPMSYVVPQMMGQHVEPDPDLRHEDDPDDGQEEDDRDDII